jgi:putative transposase
MHPPRLSLFSYTGLQRYFVTMCTAGRQRVFECEAWDSLVLVHFRQSAARHDSALLAYCFMPDHLHLLIEARDEGGNLLSLVSDAKQRSGYAYRRLTGCALWHRGFYDHVLRDEERTLAIVRYIMTNPVRAGLANRVGGYPFCGSDMFSMEEICACQEIWEPDRRSRGRQP